MGAPEKIIITSRFAITAKNHFGTPSIEFIFLNLGAQVLPIHFHSSATVYKILTQVISRSVAEAMEYCDDANTMETRKFVRMFDTFLIC